MTNHTQTQVQINNKAYHVIGIFTGKIELKDTLEDLITKKVLQELHEPEQNQNSRNLRPTE